jgi:acetylornithine deacetylase
MELMAIPSLSGHEGAVGARVARWLEERGWTVTTQEVTPKRHNVWATRADVSRFHQWSDECVTLSTHLDTVPPYIPPRLDGHRLYGRGACDAKGIAAAMLTAAEHLVASGERRVALLFVVGEEEGSDGAQAANRLPARSRYLINGEPTESRMASGTKGSFRITVRTTGREAHSAYPALGQSAISSLVALLARLPSVTLPSDPVLGDTTINIGVIRGGTAANVVPGAAEAELLARIVGDVQVVQSAVERWASGVAQIEYGAYIPPQHLHTLPGFETEAVAYTSDIPLLDHWGAPLLFGPGSIHVAHTPDEYIDVDELRAGVEVYARLVRTLLGSMEPAR